jgi:hypothetical protein
MKKRNKHNKSNSDDDVVDDDTGKRRNKKVFAFLASGLDRHMTQLGEKKKKKGKKTVFLKIVNYLQQRRR